MKGIVKISHLHKMGCFFKEISIQRVSTVFLKAGI